MVMIFIVSIYLIVYEIISTKKSNFAYQVKSCLVSNITTLRTQKREMKIEIQKKFDE